MGFCTDSQSQSNNGQWVDPLGPSSVGANGKASYGATGAPQIRTGLFNYLQSYEPQMMQAGSNLAARLQQAGNSPAWSNAVEQANRNLAGDYLEGSPAIDRQAAQTLASAANEDARIRSQFAKNGASFGTAEQQAEQANRAAATAGANATNAQTYAQNYEAERANQNNAGNQLATSLSAPLNYLSQVSGAYTTPLTQAGNLLSALSSGGQVFSTGSSGSSNPGIGQSILAGIGAL